MNTPISLRSRVAMCTGILLASPALAQSVELVVVAKGASSRQTSAADVSPAPAEELPFHFAASVEGIDLDLLPSAPVVTGPITNPEPGHNGGVLGFNPESGAWEYGWPEFFGWNTQTQAELDTLFASGAYSIDLNGTVVTVVLSGDALPDAPMFTLTGGTWINGVYAVDPDHELTITTTAYAGYGTHAEDVIWLGILGPDYVDEVSQFASEEPSNFASLTVPANTLTPGEHYPVEAGFVAVVDADDSVSGHPDALAAAAYEHATELVVLARCAADLNADGVIDFFDVQAYLNAYTAQDPSADLNHDGLFDFFDVQAYLNLYSAGCP